MANLSKRPKGEMEQLSELGMSPLKVATMTAAGYTPEKMAEMLGLITSTLIEGMSANKVQRIASGGGINEFVDPDHPTRLKAAAELGRLVTDMADLKGTERSGPGGAGTHITLNVPFLDQLSKASEPIDVTPEQ